VIDINSNPNNPIIGSRSFGNSPEMVISFGKKALEGYHDAHIITSLKHFPGHGDVSIDSHQDLPILYKSKKQLEQMELRPFKALSPFADTIMTAHIMIPSIDPFNCATLSPAILSILRNEMHYNGVIISDSLVMEGLLKNCPSIEHAALKALNAGCDLLILGGKQLIGTSEGFELSVEDVARIHHFLVQALQEGTLPEQRVNDALQRILSLKKRKLKF
jgi:beta-N-acetylhexosaminidase